MADPGRGTYLGANTLPLAPEIYENVQLLGVIYAENEQILMEESLH